ncbi:MAG: cell division protein FtsZ [Anaerolineae bacterium]|jgi:cell division protein FtsZ
MENRDSWRGASIKVVGVGGAGGNAVDRMIQVGIPAVDFIVLNTDAQALAGSDASSRIQMGERLTRGLGTGGDPAIGAEAAERSRESIAAAVRGADMVFIAAGMGGGTGSGAAPVVAQIGREQGALTIAVVTTPFVFEGSRRQTIAEAAIERLKEEVDTLVVVSNDRLLHLVNERISLDIAFRIADEVLRQGIQGISELVTQPGLINLDFADVRSIMDRAGGALVSIGYGEGREKAVEAARVALASPLLDIRSVNGTDGLLVNVTGGEDLTLAEVDQAMEIISRAAMPHAQIIFGAVIDPRMEGRVQITLIATGLGIGKVTKVPPRAEDVSMPFDPENLFADDLAVPAFMRSPAQTQANWRT